MRDLRPVWILAFCAAAMAAAGCGHTKNSRFYLLTGAPPDAVGPEGAGEGLVIGLCEVEIPGHINRPQIVTRGSQGRIEVAELDRWAEPLEENVTRVLGENLSRLLPGIRVLTYPWGAPDALNGQVLVRIRRFDADAGGECVLEASWILFREEDRRPVALKFGESRNRRAAEGKGYPERVAALSLLVGDLAADLAREIPALKEK